MVINSISYDNNCYTKCTFIRDVGINVFDQLENFDILLKSLFFSRCVLYKKFNQDNIWTKPANEHW